MYVYVCVYVCMHVCMFVCMHMCVCVRVRACVRFCSALGEMHVDTLATQHNLAELYLANGDKHKASELQVEMLRKFGIEAEPKQE